MKLLLAYPVPRILLLISLVCTFYYVCTCNNWVIWTL